MFGLIIVFIICLSSGFSTVYFEMLLKSKSNSISIWMRNVQLSFFGTIFSLVNVYILDGKIVKDFGVLHGYDYLVLSIVFLSALGGLLIASVIAYADNIIKGFAISISILLSTFISYVYLNDIIIDE
jgi:UDP-sugar transporter A1/2/3